MPQPNNQRHFRKSPCRYGAGMCGRNRGLNRYRATKVRQYTGAGVIPRRARTFSITSGRTVGHREI